MSIVASYNTVTSVITLHGIRVGKNLEIFINYLTSNNYIELDSTLLKHARFIGIYHDIGKIKIPNSILYKSGKLNDEEFSLIKSHTSLGLQITEENSELFSKLNNNALKSLKEVVISHHERWDGRGYPYGLVSKSIPLIGRICAIVDTFDVITHDRPYKVSSSVETAKEEINRCKGSQFDPTLVKGFLECYHLFRV